MARPRIKAVRLTANDIQTVVKEADRRHLVKREHHNKVVVPIARKIKSKNPKKSWVDCCSVARTSLNLFNTISI